MQFNANEFLAIFFGTTDANIIVAGGLMCLLGWLLSLVVMVARAVKRNRSTPNQFSWQYFLRDSAPSLVAGLLCAFALLRFSSWAIGANSTMEVAFILGFANMTCVQLLRGVTEKAIDIFSSFSKSRS